MDNKTHLKGIFILLTLAIVVCGCQEKQKSTDGVLPKDTSATVINIDADKTAEPISKYIYGQFIEHLGKCIYGGIWAEMIEDRKFYYPVNNDQPKYKEIKTDGWLGKPRPTVFKALASTPWKPVGNGNFVTMLTLDSYVGVHTPQISLPGNGDVAGISQSGLGLVKNKKYTGRVVLAGEWAAAPVKVSLIWGEGKKQRQTVTIKMLSKDFKTYPLKFKAGADTDDATIEIVSGGKGSFKVGTVSLMPADNIGGWRKDVVSLLKQLNSPVYRWPGGNFVSGYDWKDGVGPVDKRPPRKNPAWTGVEHNDVGMHEFINLCRMINTEPFIAVNTGLGKVDEVKQQIEYCNGPTSTPMGRWRAVNGSRKPFNVKWWAVGNEMYGNWQLGHMPLSEYTKKHNEVADAMWSIDPDAQLIAVGDVGNWSETMLKDCSDHMNLLSEHFYATHKDDDVEHIWQARTRVKEIADAHRKYRDEIPGLAGKDIRVALDEWNYWLTPYIYGELGCRYYFRDALGIAAGLHEYFRNSDIIFMANYAQTVNVIGCIKTTKTDAGFAATGLPLMMYRRHFGTLPIEVENSNPQLDVMAALTENKKTLTIGVVNISSESQTLKLNLDNIKLNGMGKAWSIQNDDMMAYNDPGEEPNVAIKENKVRFTNTLTVKPGSITIFRLDIK